MKRILSLFALLLVSLVGFSQAPSNYTNINGRYRWIAGMFDSTFHIPKGSNPSLRTGGSTNAGGLFYNTSDSSVYTYTGTQWIKLRGSINPSDTTNKYITQVYKKNASDSVFYVKGGNHLFAFIDSVGSPGGGGGGKIYYFNGGVSMGTFGGFTMYELGDTANTGAAANFTRATTGNIANFITDVNKPGLLQIPSGVWSVDAWLSESGGGSNHAEIYVIVEKWNGTSISTIATSPVEQITEGNSPNLYTWSVSIPTTTLAVTDRIIIQFYIQNTNGKTVTLYTQNGYVGLVHTTFTTGIGAINGLTTPAQYLVTGTSGTDFNINSATATHTFNLPTASATNRGALSSADWTTFNNKGNGSVTSIATNTSTGIAGGTITGSGTLYIDTTLISTRAWRQKGVDSVAGLLSGYVPTSRTLSINGTSYDLSANRSWSVGTVTSVASGYGLSGGTITSAGTLSVDSSTLSNYYLRRKDSLTSTNLLGYVTKTVLADTAAAIRGADAGGTVTSVATNTGTGITGGTITTSGTLAIDTLLVSTRAWRQKGVDSVAALANTKVSSVGGTSPIASSGGTSPTISISQAGASTDGYLSSTDWNTFNNKQNALTNPVTGTGTTNYIPKFTGANTLGNSQIIDNTNILINRTSSFSSGTYTGQKLQITGGIGINSDGADGVSRLTLLGNSSTGDGTIDWGGNGNFNLVFSNNGSERMRLDASGNLGLGTSSPAYKLDVSGQIRALLTTSTAGYQSGIILTDASTTTLGFGLQNTGGSNLPFIYGNTGIGFGTNLSTRMTLDASGNLGLGVTPSAWYNTEKALQFNTGSIYTSSSPNSIIGIGQNYYYDGNDKYYANGKAALYNLINGGFQWYTAGTGTANGTITFSQRMTLNNDGNLGLGVTPSAHAGGGSFQLGSGKNISFSGQEGYIAANQYYNGASNIYIANGYATQYAQESGKHIWSIAPSGTAGNAISFTQAMTLFSTGNLAVGGTSDNGSRLNVTGAATFSSSVTANGILTVNEDGVGTKNITIRSNWAGVDPAINVTTNNALLLMTNNSERMRITSGGNVGIGTTSPIRRLESALSSLGAVATTLRITNSSVASVSTGQGVQMEFVNDNGFSSSSSSSAIRSITTNAANGAADLLFLNWDGSAVSERMRITSGGELLINTTSDAGDYKLQVNGNGLFDGQLQVNFNTGGLKLNRTAVTNYTGIYYSTGNSDKWFVGMRENLSSNNHIHYSETLAADVLTLNQTTGDATFYGSIKTGSSNPAWKLGSYGTAIGGSDGYAVAVEIGGTTYYLMTAYLPEPAPEPVATAGPAASFSPTFEQPIIKLKSESEKIKALETELAELKEMIKSIKNK